SFSVAAGACRFSAYPLQLFREGVQAAGSALGYHHRIGEHRSGFSVSPLWIENVDVEREDHPGLELAADRRQRSLVSLQSVEAVTREFKRGESVAVNSGLADSKSGVVNDALHLVHAFHDRLAGAEQFHAAAERGDAAVVAALRLLVRLTETQRALDVSEISADLRMDLAGDEFSRLHGPRCRKPERMRERIAIAGPEEQGWLFAAVREHRLHHVGMHLGLANARPCTIAASLEHLVAENSRLFEQSDFLGAFDRPGPLQQIAEIDEAHIRQ